MDLVTGREAAKILGVAGVTVADWVARGKLVPAGILGTTKRIFLFDRKTIEQLAAERNQPQPATAAQAA